ncbi:bifunctional DNA-binding transcriptional regulator/O6-methylguanine-DNA methyltransferase Ada [Leptolyngbya ohadii]|uniref:bifunctional DNA-binding transcriptional regulator/O6-methylguanine-DNA methyltransferase Ada n=1 Tax=Leptolyngbya ohadii TaxID=1962290 RepID=UPI000B59A786|nr:bifunctional DNA-binding transcriptional regulator/O6-methylguanine-DNA methyltransferase Ada [Leptolyngbya ohadii]
MDNVTATRSIDTEEMLWQAVLQRDSAFEGLVFYGVRSTKIYCRPTCPSRKPNRDRVCFFDSVQSAEAAGYRPCKRCLPQEATLPNSNLAKVLVICRYLDSHSETIPSLAELGSSVKMSPAHLQRTFKQIMGVTPFQYADARRLDRFKQQIRHGKPIANALYHTGYGASSRLYEKAPKQLGMTPAAYQRSGRGELIRYAIVESPLGYLLVAATDRGLCSVRLGGGAAELEAELHQEFKNAQFQADDRQLQEWVQPIVNYLSGLNSLPQLPIDIQATAFQRQVWEALQAIPLGTTATYSDIADRIGQPKAVRAVARACATNPIALVIPCHRVIQKSGGLSGYRWGIDRKRELLDLEQRLSQLEVGDRASETESRD